MTMMNQRAHTKIENARDTYTACKAKLYTKKCDEFKKKRMILG